MRIKASFWSGTTAFFTVFAALAAESPMPIQHLLQTSYTSSDYGRGSASVSYGDGHSAVFHNPAVMGVNPRFSFEGGYIQGSEGFVGSLVDGTNPTLSAGVGYLQAKTDQDQTLRRVPVAMSTRVLDHLSLGTTVSYTRLDDLSDWPVDVGAWIYLSPQWSMGILGKNIFSSEPVFEGRGLQVGLQYRFPIPLAVSLQAGRDFERTETMSFGTGAEVALPVGLTLMAGIRQTGYEGVRGYWSSGVGYQSAEFRVHLAYEQALKEPLKPSLFAGFTYWQ